MNITSKFMKLFSKNRDDASQSQSFYATLYPESVRYALGHNSAKLGKAELHALIHNFTYEVVYLMVKAVTYDIHEQRRFIEELTRLYVQEDYQDDLKSFLKCEIDRLPEDTIVKGTKLAQLSRYGSAYWQKAFRNLVEECVEEDELAVPRLVAHTPFIAYHHFVDIYKERGVGRLSVIVPHWMMDKTNPLMGYRIILQKRIEVVFQEKAICLHGHWDCLGQECLRDQTYCRRSFFIDDTINTRLNQNKSDKFLVIRVWCSSTGRENTSYNGLTQAQWHHHKQLTRD